MNLLIFTRFIIPIHMFQGKTLQKNECCFLRVFADMCKNDMNRNSKKHLHVFYFEIGRRSSQL